MITVYMPCATNPHILYDAVRSLENQVDRFCIINNTGEPLEMVSIKMDIYDSPVPLLYGQSLNYAIKKTKDEPYCIWAHNDIIVKDGAIQALLNKYEEVKDTRWGQILSDYDSLCLFNPKFFVEQGMWEEYMLFPFYFSDNHRARLMTLTDYKIYSCSEAAEKVHHLGSNSIRFDFQYRRRNEWMFKHHGNLYREIWGGDPGFERVSDATLGGLYKGKV